MKLNSIPEVKVDAINAGLKSFFIRNDLPVIQLKGTRRKRLLRAFQLDNEYRASRGMKQEEQHGITLVWNRYAGFADDNQMHSYCEFTIWANSESLASKNIDPLSASVIRDCGHFKLRVWVSGRQRYFLFNLRKGR